MLETKMEEKLAALLAQLDPRYLTLPQAMLIYRHMMAMGEPPRTILEIGTFAGTGAILLAAMAKEWGGHVTTVDLPWVGESNEHFTVTADEQAKSLGLTNLTIVRRKDGAEGWMRENRSPALDLVYLDGGHGWTNTVLQVALSLSCLRPGGWLVMDDLHNAAWPDVQEVWETVTRGLTQNRYEHGCTGFAQRPTGLK